MIRPAKFKMAPKFEQAILDLSANHLYSARNAKHDELDALIEDINELKNQSTATRTTKSKFYRLKDKSEKLTTLLDNENRELCKAFFMINPNMADDPKYINDQKSFRGWIRKLDDAVLDLEAKLEDDNVIPTQTILQAPAVSDVNTILLQM